ncbi:MAG: dihydroxyacetone kinase family protein [Bifidobacteriaceae bacterium]|nr:dihydroxyacetone kinase family protein [Bifidobacteriaceae bacterium]
MADEEKFDLNAEENDMAVVINDAAQFADEAVKGFVLANHRYVRATQGGVLRSTKDTESHVAVVIGGGSGHYPAFGGMVGPGMAYGAVLGNVFASPSAHQVVSVCRKADQGRGIMLLFGNYAGDLLNFTRAGQILKEEGHDVRILPITDDIYSAPKNERIKRRGIAGDLAVIKIASAAASLGYDLDEVERVSRLANDRTNSIGVAFSGCTLPGADHPLFDVPQGKMAVGMGIHGEQGIDEVAAPSPDQLAELMTTGLLKESPDVEEAAKPRVVPIVNGLGSMKYEELFLLYSKIEKLLVKSGLEVLDPQVGEFCTSFDMCGVSLSLLWMNDELLDLWNVPADSPAFHQGVVSQEDLSTDNELYPQTESNDEETLCVEASEESHACALRLAEMMHTISYVMDEKVDNLGRIDSIAGDGDHGIGMQRGATAASTAAGNAVILGAGLRTTLNTAADAWEDKAGGTSGILWGMMLHAMAKHCDDTNPPTDADIVNGIVAAKNAVMEFGGASCGDKTMVDAIVPFADSLETEDGPLSATWRKAAQVSSAAAEATKDLLPRMGRARSHGKQALGVPDPGALSFSYIVSALTPYFEDRGMDDSEATTADGDLVRAS